MAARALTCAAAAGWNAMSRWPKQERHYRGLKTMAAVRVVEE